MATPKRIALALFILSLSLASLVSSGPPVATAQTQDDPQSQGTVSLPEPDTPGPKTVSGPAIVVGTAIPGSPIVGTNVRAAGGPGTGTQAEISMASSGSSIVITFNGGPTGAGFVTSTDGGVTFSANASPPVPAGSNPCCDPGVVADLLGRFYFVQLYRDDGAGNCTNSLHVSTDGGQTFSNIVGSPYSYGPGTDFPDMPHVGIDRLNLVSGQPQLYVFTRHFTSGINCPQTGTGGTVQGEVTCSTDGGLNWAASTVLSPFTDLAHWATGSDGSVYLVGNGTGTTTGGSILLRRSTNDCNAGLNLGAPVTVTDDVTYGPTGIDREFPQPYVVVDKLDPDIAYVAWSSDRITSDGDRDVFLARCSFTGTAGSCEAPIRINDNPIGDNTAQYFPMLCVDPSNVIQLSWNDQRAGGNSTDIYHTEVSTDGGGLSVGPSYLTSEVPFTPFNFGGTPDYGDYNENNDACDGEHMYAAWTSHVSPPGILPASNDPDVFFAVINNLGDIRVSGPLDFGDVCIGSSQTRQLQIFNVGDAFLTVNNVSNVAGSTDITVDPEPEVPLTVGPGGQVNFTVRCTPTSLGTKTATIRIESDDPDQPQIDLAATCNVAEQDINVSIADAGSYGDVCLGDFDDLTLQILNQGACDLEISDIVSSNPTEFVLPDSLQFPLVLSPDANANVPIRFQPDTDLACSDSDTRVADITISSDDPDEPTVVEGVSGQVPCPVASTSGELNFGQLCIGDSQTQTVDVCDTGPCNMSVTGAELIGPDCDDLTLVSPDPPPTADDPLVISPDFCFGFVVKYEPDDFTPPDCSLQITTDDPDSPTITFPIDASVGAPDLVLDPPDLYGIYAFPPTVTDPEGDLACYSERTVVIRNVGACPAEITDITAADSPPFQVVAPTQFPLTLPPGEETLEVTVRFAPVTGGGSVTEPDETTGTLTVDYDPGANQTTGNVCGEAVVQSGGRWLVIDGSDVPIDSVDRMTLTSKGIHEPQPVSIKLKNVPLSTYDICGNTVRFHLSQEDLPSTETTGSNPNSSYTILAKEGRQQLRKSFTLGQCEFKVDTIKLR